MGRKKLDKVENDEKKKQMVAFKKTTLTLLKKALELSTLCNVQVCVIIFGPNGEPPYVWPEDPTRLNNVLAVYSNTPDEQRRKRALNLSTLPKISENNQILETGNLNQVDNLTWDDRVNNLSTDEFVGLVHELDSKLEIVNAKIEMMKNLSQSSTKLEDAAAYYVNNNMQFIPNIESECENVNILDDFLRYMEEEERNKMQNFNDNNYASAGSSLSNMFNFNNVGSNLLNFNDNNWCNFNDGSNLCNNTINFTNGLMGPMTWHDPEAQAQAQLEAQHQQPANYGQLTPFTYDFFN